MTEATGVPIVTTETTSAEPASVRPGMKTSEFVVTILMVVLGSVLASGLIVNNTALQLAGVAMATLKAISYTWSRTVVKTAAMLVLIGFALHTTTACGAGDRQKALATSLHTVAIAETAFLAFDAHHELDIVSAATSHEDGEKQLADYRKDRQKVNRGFAAAVAAIDTAATVDDDPSVAGAVKAVTFVVQLLAAIGVKL